MVFWTLLANIYLFKVNNRKLEKVLIKNVVPVSLFLTLNIFHTFFSVSNVDFEQANVCWVAFTKKQWNASFEKWRFLRIVKPIVAQGVRNFALKKQVSRPWWRHFSSKSLGNFNQNKILELVTRDFYLDYNSRVSNSRLLSWY